MSYCEREWAMVYPNPAERAEAEEEMNARSDAYDPCGVDYYEEYGVFSILVLDQSRGVDGFWVDVRLVEGELSKAWKNSDMYEAMRDGDWWYVLEMGDENIVQKAFNAAETYAEEQGLIYRLPDGTWAEAEPY